MSKTTGSKVSIDENSSFACIALCRENNISQWTDRGFSTPIRLKEKSFWFTSYLVTGLKIISVESPDTMTGQIHFSSVTFVILFFFHSNYCICSLFTFSFFVLARCLNNKKEIPRLILILKRRRILLD